LEKHYTICPVCGSDDLHYKLKALDHTVSKKEFEIWQCSNCTLRLTQDVPDINSIGQYYQSDNYISHTNTKKGWINSLYHFVRELTLSNKRRLILSLTNLKSGKLLDIGAGTGSFAGFMKTYGWDVTGLEPDEQARQQAQTVNNIELIGPENFYLLPEESFDVITMWHVFEHVHDLQGYLTQLKKLIKPGGKIFIAVPNYTSFDASFYKNYWAAYDVPRHLYHFSPLSLKKLFTEHDVELQSTRAMPYDSFYISFLSERYKKNKLGLLRGFLIGIYSNLIAFVNKERCSSLIYIINK
jgi:2-polyprenyl-3-methyl-5-hydroxy-6-metoxy-1,4-benzoquinol methylase